MTTLSLLQWSVYCLHGGCLLTTVPVTLHKFASSLPLFQWTVVSSDYLLIARFITLHYILRNLLFERWNEWHTTLLFGRIIRASNIISLIRQLISNCCVHCIPRIAKLKKSAVLHTVVGLHHTKDINRVFILILSEISYCLS